MAAPDERGDSGFVRVLGEQGAGRVRGGGSRVHVEAGEGQPGEFRRADVHLAGGGVELGRERATLVVGVLALHDGDDRGVLQLPGPGVAGALVGRSGRETCLREIVAVAEAGEHEGWVDRRDHVGETTPCPRRG
ncbi:hypothetical protein ACFTY8_20185 [Streptomyces mirabilis]|uniref:hypothetical protein n=1 Tax=Streptomyces mirabilis TaxID=68239 RepID=UPI00362F7DDC